MLVEFRDTKNQPVWVNPMHVALVEYNSASSSTLTLVIAQETTAGRSKPLCITVQTAAPEAVRRLNSGQMPLGHQPLAAASAEVVLPPSQG